MKTSDFVVGNCNFSLISKDEYTILYLDTANVLQIFLNDKITFKAISLSNTEDKISFIISPNNIYYKAFKKILGDDDYLHIVSDENNYIQFEKRENDIILIIKDINHKDDEVEYFVNISKERLDNKLFTKFFFFQEELVKTNENYSKIDSMLVGYTTNLVINKYENLKDKYSGFILNNMMTLCRENEILDAIVDYDIIYIIAVLYDVKQNITTETKSLHDEMNLDFIRKYFDKDQVELICDALDNYSNDEYTGDNIYLYILRYTIYNKDFEKEIRTTYNQLLSYYDTENRGELIERIKQIMLEKISNNEDLYIRSENIRDSLNKVLLKLK